MTDAAIFVERLAKRYRIGAQRDPYPRLTESLSDLFTTPFRRKGPSAERTDFWALRDVSFEIPPGLAFSVIGRNGAGKSTLLKILSRITDPTSGRARIHGRVGSLLEVGTGFHQELTGRENVFLSGAILGMRRAEILRKFDEIVEFADIGQFIDTPVKRYSSGMKVRLGFAVAAFLEPEILLIDEVLSVGDAEFQRRCLGRLGDVTREGRTVMFVSHDLGSVSNLTRTCLYLENGRVKLIGRTDEVVKAYQVDSLEARDDPNRGLAFYRRANVPDAPVKIVAIWAASQTSGAPVLEMGSPIEVEIEIEVIRPVSGMTVSATLRDQRGQVIAVIYSPDRGMTLTSSTGVVTVSLRIDDVPLAPGQYFIDVGINQSVGTSASDVILGYPLLEVENTGDVVQWLDRPWGPLHPRSVEWRQSEPEPARPARR